MTLWKNGRLDLGRLGRLEAWRPMNVGGIWHWDWVLDDRYCAVGHNYGSKAAAERAAVAWMRRAIRQASRRMEGG